ncbi:hypothetical protein TRIUR3_27440 [Triticum urartu]|uniref:PROP1-like PPR domain-containing protein n=1 Tax=Triticum urartu TaxID=4572 RepID=M8B571_TRIUA|nr:hypothetical protein TRIUR3_27440 [Triticum urartu]
MTINKSQGPAKSIQPNRLGLMLRCTYIFPLFKVFHEMVSAGIEPNVNTYGALIDGCAKAGQIAKAFGAYGIMSSKKVKPDRVVFNALISACGESGAVARAFDVLSEMTAESSESKGCKPILPDHVTVGALMKTCIQAGQADRAREVYKMLQEYSIKGTPEVYTIALRSCSLTGDLGFALKIYEDMNKIGVQPDEMFLSALVDVAGHARRADAAFEIIKDVRAKGFHVGIMAYSSCMGACCNAKDWKKALQLFEEIKAIKLIPTVPMMNALITSLCDGDQVLKAAEVLNEMKELRVRPNEITYSVLCVACERNGEAQLALDLFEQLKVDGTGLNPTIVGCLTGLCLQMFSYDLSLGNIIVRFNQGKPQIDNKWPPGNTSCLFPNMLTSSSHPSHIVPSYYHPRYFPACGQLFASMEFCFTDKILERNTEKYGLPPSLSHWTAVLLLVRPMRAMDILSNYGFPSGNHRWSATLKRCFISSAGLFEVSS